MTGEKIRMIASMTTWKKPRVFLEEVDKLPNMTPLKSEFMFSLMNAISETNSQIVMTSNAPPEQFGKLLGEYVGPPVLRRIGENGGRIWNFYKDAAQ